MRRFIYVIAAGGLFFCFTACSKKTSNSLGKVDAEFTKVLNATKTAEYRVTYKNSGGGDITEIAQNPPGKYALILVDESMYQVDKKLTDCNTINSATHCVSNLEPSRFATREADGAETRLAFANLRKEKISIKRESDQIIAGRKAICIHISQEKDSHNKGIGGLELLCVDKKTGVNLKAKTYKYKGEVASVTATSYSDHTNDSDFKPTKQEQEASDNFPNT